MPPLVKGGDYSLDHFESRAETARFACDLSDWMCLLLGLVIAFSRIFVSKIALGKFDVEENLNIAAISKLKKRNSPEAQTQDGRLEWRLSPTLGTDGLLPRLDTAAAKDRCALKRPPRPN